MIVCQPSTLRLNPAVKMLPKTGGLTARPPRPIKTFRETQQPKDIRIRTIPNTTDSSVSLTPPLTPSIQKKTTKKQYQKKKSQFKKKRQINLCPPPRGLLFFFYLSSRPWGKDRLFGISRVPAGGALEVHAGASFRRLQI